MRQQANQKQGFTLIETLVALGILVIVLTLTVSTFLIVLTRSAKVKVVKSVENDGHYALNVMERMIRNAKEITNCSADQNQISILNPDNGTTTFACVNEGTANGYLASSSARLTSPAVSLESGCQFSCLFGELEKPDQVQIFFRLSQSEASARIEEQAALDFQTTVTLRNF